MNTCDSSSSSSSSFPTFRTILWEALSYEGRESLLAEMQTRYVNDMTKHIQKETRLKNRLEWYQQRCLELEMDNERLRVKLDKLEQIQRIMEG